MLEKVFELKVTTLQGSDFHFSTIDGTLSDISMYSDYTDTAREDYVSYFQFFTPIHSFSLAAETRSPTMIQNSVAFIQILSTTSKK